MTFLFHILALTVLMACSGVTAATLTVHRSSIILHLRHLGPVGDWGGL